MVQKVSFQYQANGLKSFWVFLDSRYPKNITVLVCYFIRLFFCPLITHIFILYPGCSGSIYLSITSLVKKTLHVPSTTLTSKIKHPTHLTWSQVKESNEHPHGLSRQRKLTWRLEYGSYEVHRHLLPLLFQKQTNKRTKIPSLLLDTRKMAGMVVGLILSLPSIVTYNNSKSSIYLTN